jgi:flagellar biogenesis protein FliO
LFRSIAILLKKKKKKQQIVDKSECQENNPLWGHLIAGALLLALLAFIAFAVYHIVKRVRHRNRVRIHSNLVNDFDNFD